MARYLSTKPSLDDIVRVVKDIQRDVDALRSGNGFAIRSDIAMNGYRITGLGQPVDKSDAQPKVGDDGQQFAPLTSAYVVAGTLDTALPNERLLSGSSSITVTDNGAGGTVSIAATQSFFDALYQPLDADLTAIAALTTTSYGRGFLTQVDAAAARTYIGAGTGSGSVTSVNVSGGTTGLTFSGGPITTSGTITMSGTLAAANGGMVYPGAGIANSTGSAWGTSYTTTGSGTVVALQTSPSLVTPNIGVAAGTSIDLTGHAAIGADASVATDAILTIDETYTINANPLMGINMTIDSSSTATAIRGISATTQAAGTATIGSLSGGVIRADALGTGTQTHTSVYGMQALATHGRSDVNGSTVVTAMYGADIGATTDGTLGARSTTTQIGLQVGSSRTGGGTIGTNIGLRVASITGGSTNWAIQALGGQSYHVGNLRIGSSTAPTVALDVTGAATISGAVTLSNLSSNGVVTTSGGTGALGVTATTGSGNVVLATSPTLTTPNIGAASGTSLTLSSLTSGRVTFASTSGLLTDDSNFLFDGTTDTLTTAIFQQSTNNSGGFYGRPTAGTNDYRLFVNSSNEWELRQNVGGVVNAVYRFGGAGFYPTALEELGTASAGWGGIYLDDGGGDTARIVAPALSADITLTLPAATGTLATLAGTETFSNKTLDNSVTARSGTSTTYGRMPVCVHDQSGSLGNNPGGGDTDAMSHSLVASSLSVDGSRLQISSMFQLDDDGANNQRFRILVGSATVFDSGSASTHDTSGPLHWVEVTVVRSSASTGYYVARWFKGDGTVVAQTGTASITWGNANTVKGVVNATTVTRTKQVTLAVDTIQE